MSVFDSLMDLQRQINSQQRLINQLITLERPRSSGANGWLEIPDGSWTYTSATRIAYTGANLILAVGDQVRYKQGGAYKYGSVYGVTSTYFDVTGGSDFSVANAAITDAAFSKGGGVGHPGWFNWTPVYGGFSVNPGGDTRFVVTPNGTVKVFVYMTSSGTSNANTFTMSAPVAASATANSALGRYTDGGTATPGQGYAMISGSTITLATSGGSSAWATTGNKAAHFQLEYFI